MLKKKLNTKDNIKKINNSGGLHVVLGSFLTKFVSFFGSIFIVRLLSKTEYGILSYYENFASYFTILVGLGMASGLTRYMVLADDLPNKKACFNRAIFRGSLFNILLLTFGTLFLFFYSHPKNFVDYRILGIILILGLPFVYAINVSLSTLRAEFKYKNYAYLAFLTSVILIVGRLLGAILGGLSFTVYGRFTTEILAAVLGFYLVYKMFFLNVQSSHIEKDFKKEFDAYSFQIMLTDGLWAILMLNDLFLLGQLSGNETMIADYKVAFVIPANLAILTSAIGTYIAPYFTKYEKDNDLKMIRERSSLILKITSIILGIAVLLTLVFSKQLISLLFGPKYLSALPVMRILLLASFFNNGIRATIANILSAMGFQKINLMVAAIGVSLQLLFGLYFIPRNGALGAAYTALCVYIFMTISLLLYFWRKYFKRAKVRALS